jgi:hypothetical protein
MKIPQRHATMIDIARTRKPLRRVTLRLEKNLNPRVQDYRSSAFAAAASRRRFAYATFAYDRELVRSRPRQNIDAGWRGALAQRTRD